MKNLIKKTTRKRQQIHRTKKQKIAIVNRFKKSCLTVSAHCRKEGIWESQFYSWKHKFLTDEPMRVKTDFIQVKAPASIKPLEIILPNGIQIKLTELPDSKLIQSLMSL